MRVKAVEKLLKFDKNFAGQYSFFYLVFIESTKKKSPFFCCFGYNMYLCRNYTKEPKT